MTKNLKKENEELKQKLIIAQNWIKREVNANKISISKEKIKKNSKENIKTYFSDNIDEIIFTKINDFLGELMFLSTPEYVLENILSAEVQYYNLHNYKFTDGLGVITSYQKSVDFLIEENITKLFRKFAIKNNQRKLKRNDLIEKNLDLVVNKGYILSIGKLYNILYAIKNSEDLYEYGTIFRKFLNEYSYISEILLSNTFYELFELIVKSELFGEKRHYGVVSFEETKFARKILIGDLKEKTCIIYMLIKIGEVSI